MLTGPTRNHSGFSRVPRSMGNLRSRSRSSGQLQPPHSMWSSHSLCHFTAGNFPSPMFPSTHHLPPRWRLSSSIFETQEPYCRSEQPIHPTLKRGASPLMGASSHVEHGEARFAFGKTQPQVTCPGVLSDPGCHLERSHSHPQHPRSWLGGETGSSCWSLVIIQLFRPPTSSSAVSSMEIIWWHILRAGCISQQYGEEIVLSRSWAPFRTPHDDPLTRTCGF